MNRSDQFNGQIESAKVVGQIDVDNSPWFVVHVYGYVKIATLITNGTKFLTVSPFVCAGRRQRASLDLSRLTVTDKNILIGEISNYLNVTDSEAA